MWSGDVKRLKHVVQDASCVIYQDKDTTFGDEENGYLTRRTATEVETSLNGGQKLAQMAVCLSGLPGFPAFDVFSEPATLAQRWLTQKEEFELYATASGISDPTQKRALLLHPAGPKVRDVFNNSIPAEARGEWAESRNTSKSKRMLRWPDRHF